MDKKRENIARLVLKMVEENPVITSYMRDDSLTDEALVATLKRHYQEIIQRDFPKAWDYYIGKKDDESSFFSLTWRSFAFIRVLDLLDHEGEVYSDPNLKGAKVTSRPIGELRRLFRGEESDVNIDFVLDLLHLLRQLNGIDTQDIPTRSQVFEWMDRHPSGLDPKVIEWRKANKERIIRLLIEKIGKGEGAPRYTFEDDNSLEERWQRVNKWWDEDRFQLKFAIRDHRELEHFLGGSLEDNTSRIMEEAEAKGIPIFVTPYFLSLIDTRPPSEREYPFGDEAIRSYLFHSQDLVDEFGQIEAWEREDVVEPGKPNEAGWVLPSHNIHRRYPDVAIFIPDTMGRACGGLCSYCQRMYDFQAGRFNFDLDKLRPKRLWPERLKEAMDYFEKDPFLEDILITGGDALMSSVASLEKILNAVLEMVAARHKANLERPVEERYPEFKRVRLGTKLPIYLPQRITPQLVEMLQSFRESALTLGISQCIVQTHFSSAMEVTPASTEAVKALLGAGWAVTNQEVFTVAASRRGHSAKLRKVLNDIGVLPYYTFTVKGFFENRELFANNPRSMQEQIEEKSIGRVDLRYHSTLRAFVVDAENMVDHIATIRKADQIPFLATDRNTINLPGVGKSNTYRTIGLTNDGRRILKFEFDDTRPHSPIIEKMGSVIIIESKSVAQYLRQIEKMGEDISEYSSIWGYSAGRLEPRSPVFEGLVRQM
ncbi:MAG: KamA family radical SAM protein [Sphaerochaetaceae bacterium]|jgi:lysine 2,3-aminomutase|nr:KamA family protein [Sphaerochaetaceae bacterium]HHU89082.1 KamA family protein [Spirochaetales bacterium]